MIMILRMVEAHKRMRICCEQEEQATHKKNYIEFSCMIHISRTCFLRYLDMHSISTRRHQIMVNHFRVGTGQSRRLLQSKSCACPFHVEIYRQDMKKF
jgi:hypothetical protein